MKKGIIFAIGAGLGAIAGSVTTYFLVREDFANKANTVINNMEDYYHDKLQKALADDEDEEEESDEPADDVDNDEEPEAVKKYHHYKPEKVTDMYNTGVFSEGGKDVSKKDFEEQMDEAVKKFNDSIEKDNPGVYEITDDVFEASDKYPKVDLDYYFVDEDDNPGILKIGDEIAEQHFHRRREELISEVWKWAPDYVDESMGYTGDFYIQNDNLETFFKVTVHMPNPA